ncbi:MAG: SDR family oxidoreductase [Planctomycetota bacterium]|nr:SDR family oxidoreductase [Planctomycetota bacterium]
MGRLDGKVALVCGASMGIGAAIAKRFQEEGAKVYGLARSRERLEALGYEGVLVHDLDDLDGLSQLKLPPATILVNNTGGPPHGSILEADPHDFGKAFRRHVMASQVLLRALLPNMRAEAWGRIINIISTSVREPIAGLGVSNTTRGAMASWSKSVSKELPPGLTINNILPGFTDTERLTELKNAKASASGATADEVQASWLGAIPAQRLAEPSEMASMAAFLASDEAAYISGQSLAVDGGRMGSI